jgi:hypothetical protein
MGEKLVVRPINKGIQTDKLAFNVDNDAFPVLQNAYQWRGRIKRKRGTSLLNRLRRYFNSTSLSYTGVNPPYLITLVAGAGNLLTGPYVNSTPLSFALQTNGNIVPGTVTITDTITSTVYTDPAMNGTLSPGGTINYATGAFTIPGGGTHTVSAIFNYYPDLPVMGLEDLVLKANQFPGNLAFDTVYSYNIVTASPYSIYDVSFYKNPITGAYPSYVQKTNVTPTTWNGQNYQQFWTTNYQGALWATNGITNPFTPTNIGMQFKPIVAVTNVSATEDSLQITAHGLVVGDFVFINEVATATELNFQTGYVVTVTDANNVVIKFPNAVLSNNGTGGIAQYLTSRSDPTKDCLRWYDGDPTNGNATNPTLNGHLGWVNFMPPLSQSNFAIEDLIAAQYYLVGAKIIVPFKDMLLFIGPVVQTSTSFPMYLQDTVIFSQNGTPYYTCSFDGSSPITSATVFTPILTPVNQSATANAYWEDVTGFGGNIPAGFAQPIQTVSFNEDVLIIGFTNRQTRFVFTGSTIIPFNFFVINSELGSASTFSSITFDRGVASIGDHGIIITSQISSERIDLDIPDQVFQFNLTNNGSDRVTAQRDFINEWIYFTYLDNEVSYIFPNQTLQYNYRDHTWAIFNECYTTYGQIRKVTGNTWATIGEIYPTWASWNEPWNAGVSTLMQPQVIAGNQQGFVLVRENGTNEGNSLEITSITVTATTTTINSPNHCLNNGDYIVINSCIGTIAPFINGNIYSVDNPTNDPNNFLLSPPLASSGTYVGGGMIQRMYVPFIQTKQFPIAWEGARKTRIGVQQYLLTTTALGQIELQIYLNQNSASPYNFGPQVPDPDTVNNALIYSDILFTCPESTNIGLTPANTNLQMPTAAQQSQIWHRLNTSLIGDTVQLGFTMNDAQMRNPALTNQFSEIELHSFIIDVTPSQVLA